MLSISQVGFSQSETVKQDSIVNDSVRYYQYRLEFNGVKYKGFAEDAVSQLGEIFQTKPSFCETIGQYVVISSKDVSMGDVVKPFENTAFKLTYFKKDLVNK